MPIGDVDEARMDSAPHRGRENPAGYKRRDPCATLPVGALSAPQRVIGASHEDRGAVVIRPDKESVLPHPLAVERPGEVLHRSIHEAEHATEDGALGIVQVQVRFNKFPWRLQRRVSVVQREVQEQGPARVMRLDHADRLRGEEVPGVGAIVPYGGFRGWSSFALAYSGGE